MSSDGAVRGFILQPTYRIEAGRTVVHLYGRLETGETFLVRDDREIPHFYVEASDAKWARRLGATRQVPSDRKTLVGAPVVRIEVSKPGDTPPLRDRLQTAGVACYEADVRFAMRYLIDRGIRACLAIRGQSSPGQGIERVFVNPEVEPADWVPELSILSFDIETDPRGRRLLSIALWGCGASEVLLFTPQGYSAPSGSATFSSERQLLEAFCHRVRELDPDVLTGWNVIDFDLVVLLRLAERWGLGLELGRGAGNVRLQNDGRGRGSTRAKLPGRLVMDGIQQLRGAFVKMEDYSLDAVAREVLGEGKTLPGHDRAEEILRCFKEDRERFVEYNLTDARLVLEILQELRLPELAVERSRLTGMPPDRVAASIASLDFLYLSELGRRGVVAPTVGGGGEDSEATAGGYVLEPRPGLYRNVLVFDFKSLYPSIIRTFHIDPLGYLPEPGGGDDPIVAPNGAAFRRQPGILPRLLDELFARRRQADERGDQVTSYAIKILMNSFYGVLATPACRFFNPKISNAITSFGREVLLWTRDRIETAGYGVLYGDTDSLFVETGLESPEEARRLGEELAERLNRHLPLHIREGWGVESYFELELETLFLRLLLPVVRGGAGGARKRYAGLVEEDGRQRVTFTGLEVVRRDWTELARRLQRQLYERLFFDRPVEDYLRDVVKELREGRLDDLLIYRKAMRKDPDEYTSTTPPHVAAARKMTRPASGLIAYVVTTAGPEPAQERRHPLDYQHYLEKQIRPVSEPLLEILELDFDRVVGDDRQMALF